MKRTIVVYLPLEEKPKKYILSEEEYDEFLYSYYSETWWEVMVGTTMVRINTKLVVKIEELEYVPPED